MALLLAHYGYVIRDGVIHIEGPAGTAIARRQCEAFLPRWHGLPIVRAQL